MIIWPCNQQLLHRSLYFTLCGRLFVYGGYWTTNARSTRCCVPCEIDQARSCAIHSHGGRESCVWQQAWTLRRRQQNRIELYAAGKSEAEVTSNKKLRLRYCTIVANYWQRRIVARPLCDSRAACSYCLSDILFWHRLKHAYNSLFCS